MAEQTMPRAQNYTIDPERPIGQDIDDDKNRQTLDDVPPAVSVRHAEDAEAIRELSQGAAEAHEERVERERQADEERAQADKPKPSELLAEREGRAEGDQSDEQKAKSKQSKTK